MDNQNIKCVMVIDENLPLGLIANTAAVIGITLGKTFPECVGQDVQDKTSFKHLGIIEFPVPILKANAIFLKGLRGRLYQQEFEELTIVDFSDVAQGCKTYDEFTDKIALVEEGDLQYRGIGIYGNKKLVNKLVGSLPLLR